MAPRGAGEGFEDLEPVRACLRHLTGVGGEGEQGVEDYTKDSRILLKRDNIIADFDLGVVVKLVCGWRKQSDAGLRSGDV